MSKHKKLRISMTDREVAWGWLYLALELFIFPSLIPMLNGALPVPLSDAWLNFLYFSLNFLAMGLIFRGFLIRSISQAGHHFGKILKAVVLGYVAYWVGTFV